MEPVYGPDECSGELTQVGQDSGSVQGSRGMGYPMYVFPFFPRKRFGEAEEEQQEELEVEAEGGTGGRRRGDIWEEVARSKEEGGERLKEEALTSGRDRRSGLAVQNPFTASKEQLEEAEADLVFEGLDTYCDISLVSQAIILLKI